MPEIFGMRRACREVQWAVGLGAIGTWPPRLAPSSWAPASGVLARIWRCPNGEPFCRRLRSQPWRSRFGKTSQTELSSRDSFPVNQVGLRAQVSGYLTEIHFD